MSDSGAISNLLCRRRGLGDQTGKADPEEKLSEQMTTGFSQEGEINWGIKLEDLRDDFKGLVRHALLICVSAGKFRFLVGRDCSGSLKAPR